MENDNLSSVFDNLPFSIFHDRFLCGASALREARHVSRMQLCLAMAGLDESNMSANVLSSDIKLYATARALLISHSELTIKVLMQVHSLLMPGVSHSGMLRIGDGWLGDSKETATYIAPNATEVPLLLENLLAAINKKKHFSLEDVVEYYCRFLTIHPFRDGNGRVSRLLVDFMIQKSDLNIHLSLFRLGSDVAIYQDAVLSFGIKTNLGMNSSYWRNMKTWISNYQARAEVLLRQLEYSFTEKLINTSLDRVDLRVIKSLLKQPILSVESLCTDVEVNLDDALYSLNKLIKKNLLKPYRTKQNPDLEILVSREVCQFSMRLDELLFVNKVLPLSTTANTATKKIASCDN